MCLKFKKNEEGRFVMSQMPVFAITDDKKALRSIKLSRVPRP